MSKFCQTFQSPYSFYKPPYCFHIAFFSLSEFGGQIFENIFFFLVLLVQKIYFDKNHWFQLLSTKNEWIISLFLISVTLHNLSVSHSIISFVCKKKQGLTFNQNLYCYSSPSHPTWENFVSLFALWLFFVFFVFVFWTIEMTTANVQGLTHPNPQQNVLTKSP